VEMPMTLDEEIFEGEANELENGAFVSFRYMGESNGIPIGPKISIVLFPPFSPFSLLPSPFSSLLFSSSLQAYQIIQFLLFLFYTRTYILDVLT
jgi:hypothetical protein